MKMTYTAYGNTYSIETDHDDLHIDDLFDSVVVPLLVAAGWKYGIVMSMLAEEDDA